MFLTTVRCLRCGYAHHNHTNIYGKVCFRCGRFIEPLHQAPLLIEGEKKLKIYQEKIRNLIRRDIK